MTVSFLDVVTPSDVAVSAARTCYFPNGIVTPSQSSNWKRKKSLLASIFKAGHHTTLQHTHITMLIEGVSRHLIWRLLHAHVHYNSEQISQRYAKMKADAFYIPHNGDPQKWGQFYAQSFEDYEALIDILHEDAKKALPKFRQGQEHKIAQEMARYLLPQGMQAYLYHTVNITTILRYIAVAPTVPEATHEALEFAQALEANLLHIDESLAPLIEHAKNAHAPFAHFDMATLKNRINATSNVKVYDVVGDASFDMNENYADVLRTNQIYHDSGILGSFNTYMRLSLSADAQNQRHRKSPAVRPTVQSNYTRNYYTPPLIANNPKAKALYDTSVARMYDFFEAQAKIIGFSEAVYALYNAHTIEIVEHNDFSSFHHKAQMRLCYNAQQEIYDIVYEQVKQLRAMGIQGSEKFLPPCSVRYMHNIKPICPEGTRYCGVKVWKQDFSTYKRTI